MVFIEALKVVFNEWLMLELIINVSELPLTVFELKLLGKNRFAINNLENNNLQNRKFIIFPKKIPKYTSIRFLEIG